MRLYPLPASSDLTSAAVRLDTARKRAVRAEQLLKDEAGSQRSVEEAQAELAMAEAQSAAVRPRLTSGARKGALAVESPQAGVLRDVFVGPGQSVAAGAPLFQVEARASSGCGCRSTWGIWAACRWARRSRCSRWARPPRPACRRPSRWRRRPRPTRRRPAPISIFKLDNSRGRSSGPGSGCGWRLPLVGSEEGLVIPWSAVVHDIHGGTWVYELIAPRVYRRVRVEVKHLAGSDAEALAVLGRGPAPGPDRGRGGRRRAVRDRVRERQMMAWLIERALRLRLLVLCLTALLLAGRLAARALDPPRRVPRVRPAASSRSRPRRPGLSTTEVESLITVPLESALSGTSWLQTLRSKSVLGLSSVLLIFEPGTDLMRARQLVGERLATASQQLPAVARPPVILSPLSSMSRALKIGISSKTLDQVGMTTLARWTIRPRLMAIPGVANVAIWGQRDRQVQVLVDPDRLAAHKVTLAEVVAVTREATLPAAGGFVDTPNQRLSVSHLQADLGRRGPGPRAGRLPDGVAAAPGRRRRGGGGASGAHRRRHHQRRPGPPAHRREAALGQHPRGHPQGRGDPGGDAARAEGPGDRLDHLPPRDLHRDLAAQPAHGHPDRLLAGGGHPGAVPVGLAHGPHQRAGHPPVAAGGGGGPVPARRHHQHHGAGGAGHRARRGGRRRHHRRREHRAPLAGQRRLRGARPARSR